MTEHDISAPRAALAGLLAGAAGIAAGELLAGLVVGAPSLIVTVGDFIISQQPPGAKEFVVGLFGTNDKLAVNVLVLAVALAIAALLGLVARRSRDAAVAGFALVGLLVALAALREPLVAPLFAVLGPLLAVCVSVRVLEWLLALAPQVPAEADASPGRRRFLSAAAGVAAASLVAGLVGRRLLDSVPGAEASGGTSDAGAPSPGAGVRGSGAAGSGPPGSGAGGSGSTGLPVPMESAPPVPAGATLDLAGLTPLVVPTNQFYRIDTALSFPRIDASSWKVTVKGMVDREVALSYADLRALPNFEQYVTIACVSNEVGGDLVGNAKWQGVHLREVLAMAGVNPGATQIVGRSVDDFTVGFPTAWAMDTARDPMIAIGMNGAPLPVAHGYPARLIVPGLYGYVSATKWLKEIELTTLEAFDAYWVPKGWAKEAPILTQSRIDVPRGGARLPVGRVAVGGVAWAPDRGVSKVEVRIQGGDWEPATVSTPLSDATWVQWRFDWNAGAPGVFDITVRATDGTGKVQEERVTPPAPDGARGYHRVSVEIV
jgi:DMSO/TMAO reductase YedYZ molybdopterin-dependent catalytic subunit